MNKYWYFVVVSILGITTILAALTIYYSAIVSSGIALNYLDASEISKEAVVTLNVIGTAFYLGIAFFTLQITGLVILIWKRKSIMSAQQVGRAGLRSALLHLPLTLNVMCK